MPDLSLLELLKILASACPKTAQTPTNESGEREENAQNLPLFKNGGDALSFNTPPSDGVKTNRIDEKENSANINQTAYEAFCRRHDERVSRITSKKK